jgi:hypothetical protein
MSCDERLQPGEERPVLLLAKAQVKDRGAQLSGDSHQRAGQVILGARLTGRCPLAGDDDRAGELLQGLVVQVSRNPASLCFEHRTDFLLGLLAVGHIAMNSEVTDHLIAFVADRHRNHLDFDPRAVFAVRGQLGAGSIGVQKLALKLMAHLVSLTAGNLARRTTEHSSALYP